MTMTEVAFHFNAPDKLAYACRFARKAVRHDMRVVITGAEGDLRALDRMLWHMGPTDFVAHCLDDADEELRLASPVLLVRDSSDMRNGRHRELLLNLGEAVPEGYGEFAKVVEVVSRSDEADRQSARARWRYYAAQGHQIVRHDLVLKEGA